MRKLRPDFDLSAPGLREAWDRGQREQFLVTPVEGEAIRYTEGAEIGVKRCVFGAYLFPHASEMYPGRH